MQVFYSCVGCGIENLEVEVPARGTEDALTWLDRTVLRIRDAHRARSPYCESMDIHLKIPFSDSGVSLGCVKVH